MVRKPTGPSRYFSFRLSVASFFTIIPLCFADTDLPVKVEEILKEKGSIPSRHNLFMMPMLNLLYVVVAGLLVYVGLQRRYRSAVNAVRLLPSPQRPPAKISPSLQNCAAAQAADNVFFFLFVQQTGAPVVGCSGYFSSWWCVASYFTRWADLLAKGQSVSLSISLPTPEPEREILDNGFVDDEDSTHASRYRQYEDS